MNLILWIIYLLFGVIAIAPLIQGDLFRVDKKYKTFQYVSITITLWWLIDFTRLSTTDYRVVYYLTLLLFPVIFLFVIVLFIAIRRYFKIRISKPLMTFLLGLFFVDLAVSLTNELHELMIVLPLTPSITFQVLLQSPLGLAFTIHTIISYTLLGITAFYIFRYITRRARNSKDVYPFLFMLFAIVIGVGLNVIHVMIYTFHLDPTLLAVIIFISVLYYVLYIRDLKLLLGFNRNNFILDNLREKYVIVDEEGYVVDASKEFIKQFNLSFDTRKSYKELLEDVKKQAILFEASNDALKDYDSDKYYLNTIAKPIHLPFYKHSGTFYLFFDQTSNLKYINDMNYVKTHDLMTKIYNRNFLEEIRDDLDNIDVLYHLILFDVDGLKLFNDYLGHEKGDELLIFFASQIKQLTQKEDVYPIRLGGDEFVILAIDQPMSYVDNLLETLQKINDALPFLERVQYSYAIASRDKDHKTMKQLLSTADLKMYESKKSKSNYKEILEQELQTITKKKITK